MTFALREIRRRFRPWAATPSGLRLDQEASGAGGAEGLREVPRASADIEHDLVAHVEVPRDLGQRVGRLDAVKRVRIRLLQPEGADEVKRAAYARVDRVRLTDRRGGADSGGGHRRRA